MKTDNARDRKKLQELRLISNEDLEDLRAVRGDAECYALVLVRYNKSVEAVENQLQKMGRIP